MSIRIDIEFPAPVDEDVRVRFLLAMAAMPEVRRAVISPDRRRATAYAAEMPLDHIRKVLGEAELVTSRIASGLAPEEDAALGSPAGERFRPIGR